MFRLSSRFTNTTSSSDPSSSSTTGATGAAINENIENYHIYPEDLLAQKEVEIQRFKWNAFLKGKKSIWSDEWLWQNRLRRTISGMHLKKKFMRIFSSREKLQKQLKYLIRNGIPPELRGNVWYICSGAENKKKSASSYQQYNELLKRIYELDDTQVELDIEKDLYRTFPDIIKPFDYKTINSLRNILKVYALRNKEIGYCQSMNYICGLILFHLEDEERSFWVFCSLLEDILPSNYYIPSLIGGRVDQMVFQSCIAWKLPRLHSAFKSTNTLLEPIICPWFLCLYINVLPPFTVCRVWDCLFWDGSVVLFRIGLALMKSKMKYILQADDFITVFNIFKSNENKSYTFTLESVINESDSIDSEPVTPSHSALSRAASAFTFNSPSTRDSSTTTSSSIGTVAEVGSLSNTLARTSLEDGENNSNKGNASPAGSSAKISDTENLIRSAFGYRWLKSVPQGKVDFLRKRFFNLLSESDERMHTTSDYATDIDNTDNTGLEGDEVATLKNTAANAKGLNLGGDGGNDEISNVSLASSVSKPRVRFSSMENEAGEEESSIGRKSNSTPGGSISSRSLKSIGSESENGTVFEFVPSAGDASTPTDDQNENVEASSPCSMPQRRSISDQTARRFTETMRSDSVFSNKSEDWMSGTNSTRSSVYMRRSMVMLRFLNDNDAESLMELAQEFNEDYGSHVEKFARELGDKSNKRRRSTGGKKLYAATAAAASAAAYSRNERARGSLCIEDDEDNDMNETELKTEGSCCNEEDIDDGSGSDEGSEDDQDLDEMEEEYEDET